MKKLFPLFSLVALFIFQACEGPIGPPGPVGPQGPQGPQGADGTNIVSEVFEVEVTFTEEDQYSALFLFEPEIFESDVVLAYNLWGVVEDNPIWRALPQSVFFENGILVYNYDFTTADFSLFLDGAIDPSTLGPEWTDNQIFRIVVVPGEFSGARIDWTNYEAVVEFLGLEDSDFKRIERN